MYVSAILDSSDSFNLYSHSDDYKMILCIKRTISDTVALNDLRSPFMVVSLLMTQVNMCFFSLFLLN